MLELGQLGSIGLSETNMLYIHRDPISYNKNEKSKKIIDELASSLQSKCTFLQIFKIRNLINLCI